MKKIIVISAVVIVAAGVLYLGYLLRSKQTAPSGPTLPAPGGTLPTVPVSPITIPPASTQTSTAPAASATPGATADIQALDYFADSQGNITVIQPDGKIVKVAGGKAMTLGSSAVVNLSTASFSFDGKKILATFGGGASAQTSVFDVEQNIWRPLPQTVRYPAWAPDSQQIAYLSLANASGSASAGSAISLWDLTSSSTKPKGILRLHEEDARIGWLSSDQLLVRDAASAFWNSSLWLLNIPKKTFAPALIDEPGLETVWSGLPPALGLAFSSNANNEGGRLRFVDQNGKTLQRLNFLTLPSKCIFNQKGAPQAAPASASTSTAANVSSTATSTAAATRTLLCAIPRDKRALDINVLPDAYQKRALFTSDDFFEINVNDGNVKTISNDPATHFDASDLKIFGEKLFFINRFDKKVYSVKLGT